MKKLRSDSVWGALSLEQREKLEGWLFEENLGFKEVLGRAEQEFGIKATMPSLSRFYSRLGGERKTRSMAGAMDWLMNADPGPDGALAEGAVAEGAFFKVLAISAYEMSLAGPGKFKLDDVSRLARLLLDRRAQETRDGKLALERARAKTKADLDYGKGIQELANTVKEHQPKRMPTVEEVKAFYKLVGAMKVPESSMQEKKEEKI